MPIAASFSVRLSRAAPHRRRTLPPQRAGAAETSWQVQAPLASDRGRAGPLVPVAGSVHTTRHWRPAFVVALRFQ